MSIFSEPSSVVAKITFNMNEQEDLDDSVLCEIEKKLKDLEVSSKKSDEIKKKLLDQKMIVEMTKRHIVTTKTLLENGKPVDGWLSDEAYDAIIWSLFGILEEDIDHDDSHDRSTYAHDLKCVVDHDGKRYACKVIATHVLKYGDYEILLKKMRREPEIMVKYISLELLEYL